MRRIEAERAFRPWAIDLFLEGRRPDLSKLLNPNGGACAESARPRAHGLQSRPASMLKRKIKNRSCVVR
jgi:hypothetical protein